MSRESEAIKTALLSIDPVWWKDFCLLFAGEECSEEFKNELEDNENIRDTYEKLLRELDWEMAPLIRAAIGKLIAERN